jgi:hypothetical protein
MTRFIALAPLLLVACSTSEGDNFADDCAGGMCSRLSLRWNVDRGGMDSNCAAVDGSIVAVTATFQPDNRTTEFTEDCSSGAAISGQLPLGPYRLDVALQGRDGSTLSNQSTVATIAAANVLTESMVTFDVMPTVVAGGEFGACSATMPCRNANNRCVQLDSRPGYCSPTCTGACDQVEPFLPAGAHPTSICVPFSETDTTKVCVLYCGSSADCPTGMTCDMSGTNSPPYCR